MCTCICMRTKDHYFGRSMDLEYRFNESVVITPRNYEFPLKNGITIQTKHAMIGIATVIGGYPMYAEATNEKGLSMAGLHFPGNACFFRPEDGRLNLAPYELIPCFLGHYETVAQIREQIRDLNITNVPFSERIPVSELHWMISDGKECIVMEQTHDGLQCYDNPVGVMTNNPPFSYHLENLTNYMNLSPRYAQNRFSEKLKLQPYGNGMGAIGLPGDASPASRFVRAAFYKMNSVCQGDEESSVTLFFHILDTVTLVKGATITKSGEPDITTYCCCVNTDRGIYYYKTYTNYQITAVQMTDETKEKKELTVFALREKPQICYEN